MRANEFGVKSPEANVSRVMVLHQVERFLRLVISDGSGLQVSLPSIISVPRNELIVLKRLAMDYGTRFLPLAELSEVDIGISKHSTDMTTRLRDDMVNTAAWMAVQIFLEIGTATVAFLMTGQHSEEEVFEVISKGPYQDDWDGFFLWTNSSDTTQVTVLGRIEYTRVWVQRTFSEEYSRDGIKYGHGYDDSEWEESFIEGADDEE